MSLPLASVIYPSMLRGLSADALRKKFDTEPGEAARWIYAAAVDGSPAAQVLWGQMLLDGERVPKDQAAALRWFRIAAVAGHLDGVNMVGRCFDQGWGVAPDPGLAAGWYRTAADRGHGWAQFNLGVLVLRGVATASGQSSPDGEDRGGDPREALPLFVRAARGGNAKSMNMLGRYRELGWVSPPRRAIALRWYRRAAADGCFRGAYHLGRLLLEDGAAQEAARHFAASIEAAPPDFCADVAPILMAKSETAMQAIGARAMERARLDGPGQRRGTSGVQPAGRVSRRPGLSAVAAALYRRFPRWLSVARRAG